jgi:spermidine synthase
VVAESAGQLSFIENGVPLFSTGQVERAEETVHYAMAQRPDARRVLLISGGVSGTAREVVRYPAAEVDYVELDPLVLDVADELLPDALDHPRIHVIRGDGRRHVRQTAARYDVVIVDVPEPSTSQLNRYYTREFFAEVRGALRPQGVLCVSLSTYANYVSRELAALLGIAVQTLRTSFDHVLMLPGGRVFLLASDGPLTAEVAAPMAAAGVAPRLLTESYLRHTFARDRMADLQRAVDESAPVNADFNPTLYFHCLRYWLSQFRVRYGLLLGGLAVLLGGYLLLARPVPLAVFATGFAGAALEVVLLLAVQILFGSVYYQVGLTVGAFMAGLGGGSLWASRTLPRRNRRDLALLTAGVAAFAAALPSALGGLGRLAFALPDAALQTLVLLLTCVLGGLVGAVFPLAGKLDFRAVAGTAAQLLWADYLGAALGALLVSALLIPVLGVAAVCWLAAGANLLAAAIVARSKR